MKKYKTWEVLKMLEEGKAKEFKNGVWGIELVNDDILFTENGKSVKVYGFNFNESWANVQESVTFMEALESGKRVRVEHDIINKLDDRK